MMHTVCLQRQETFDGSFPHNCLTGPLNEEMRSFFNVVFRGRSALCGRVMVAGDANLDPRDKIACNISQLLIFNAVKGTTTQSIHLQCDTAMNEKPPSLCTVDSG